jgi:hypothetical protein
MTFFSIIEQIPSFINLSLSSAVKAFLSKVLGLKLRVGGDLFLSLDLIFLAIGRIAFIL